MKWLVLLLVLALSVLHHDVWWWESEERVMGFMPIGLAWHVFISIGASVVWALAVFTCWPDHLDLQFADKSESQSPSEERT